MGDLFCLASGDLYYLAGGDLYYLAGGDFAGEADGHAEEDHHHHVHRQDWLDLIHSLHEDCILTLLKQHKSTAA